MKIDIIVDLEEFSTRYFCAIFESMRSVVIGQHPIESTKRSNELVENLNWCDSKIGKPPSFENIFFHFGKNSYYLDFIIGTMKQIGNSIICKRCTIYQEYEKDGYRNCLNLKRILLNH